MKDFELKIVKVRAIIIDTCILNVVGIGKIVWVCSNKMDVQIGEPFLKITVVLKMVGTILRLHCDCRRDRALLHFRSQKQQPPQE